MSDVPLHFKSITELSGLIQSKRVSPVEVTREIIDRIGDLDSRYRSYATLMADHAMDAAGRAEREIADGRYRGPLHGVPIAVKDLCFTTGVPDHGRVQGAGRPRPNFDSTVVVRFESAGAILLGKLNLTEGAMGGYNPDFDIPLNPWNVERWAGASSSGSGVATALGLCYGSLGSDTGGSIRFPASACGVVGLKPTWGRVSRYGVLDLAQSLDHVGPMTRTSADAGVVLQAIAGRDEHDPMSLLDPVPDMLARIGDGVKGVRIGLDEGYVTEGVDPEVARAVLDGVKVLQGLGAEIVDVKMPDVDSYLPLLERALPGGSGGRPQTILPIQARRLRPVLPGLAGQGSKGQRGRLRSGEQHAGRVQRPYSPALQDVDVLACPSTVAPAHPVTPEALYGPLDEDRGTNFQRFTVPYDFNGAPTLSLPCGLSADGLPLSLQFVGKHLAEPMLCRIGHTYEQATDWHTRCPPV